MSIDVYTKNWGAHPFQFREPVLRLRPTELHVNSNGTKTNEPSFCIVMGLPPGINLQTHLRVVGDISLAMLNEAMNELGYKIEKI